MMEGPMCRFRREARARERHRHTVVDSLKALDHQRPIREADSCTAAKGALFDHLIGESTRVLAPPLAHGTDDRAEVATLCGEDVLGPRWTHRIEAALDDAILLKRPQTLR